MGHFIGLKNDSIESAFRAYIMAYPELTQYDKETGEVALLYWPKLALVNANIGAKKKAERELEDVRSIDLLKAVISCNSATLSKPYLKRIRQLQMEDINRKRELDAACTPYQSGNITQVPENEEDNEQIGIVIETVTVKGSESESENAHAKTPEKNPKKEKPELTADQTKPSKKVAPKKVHEPVHENDFPKSDAELTPMHEIPDWTKVATEMSEFFAGPGLDQWKFQCDAAGGWIDPIVITTLWAGKNCDSPYLLKNWRKQTGKFTNWIKNQLNSETVQSAKIKSLNNGKRKNGPVTPIEQREQVVKELIAEGYL